MSRLCVESLEHRLLFTWASYAKLIDQDLAATDYPDINGKGVTVALIDTGVDYNLSCMGGGFGDGYKVIDGYNFVDNSSDPMDVDGHGTGTAAVIAADSYTVDGVTYQGVAPEAKIVALKTGTEKDGFSNSNIHAALQWVIKNYKEDNISILDMSIGSGNYKTAETESPISDDLTKLRSLGIFVVAASGNTNTDFFKPISQDGIAYPAADPNVFSAGAVDSNDKIPSWCQRGSLLDELAPGVDIVVPDSNGETSAEDGTSFSSAYVAGTAALLKQADSSLNPGDIGSILMSSGTDIRDGSGDTSGTTGLLFSRLNIDSALKMELTRQATSSALICSSTFSTALDSQGVLHATYYDPKHHRLLYATRGIDGNWSRPTVIDSSGDVGSQVSVAVDSTGKVGTAYYDATNTGLKFAIYDGNSWDVSAVDSRKCTGQHPSLAFSQYGDAYVAYHRKSGGMLRLATYARDDDSWSIVSVDGANDSYKCGSDLSLDVGEAPVRSNGQFTQYDTTVAVAYSDDTNGYLKYARLDVVDPDATWYTAVVARTSSVSGIDLLLHDGFQDVGLQAQISYRDGKTGDVKYAYRNKKWFTETVTTTRTRGDTQITFDSDNNALVSFFGTGKKAIYSSLRKSSKRWSTTRQAPSGSALVVSLNDQTGESLLSYSNRARKLVRAHALVRYAGAPTHEFIER